MSVFEKGNLFGLSQDFLSTLLYFGLASNFVRKLYGKVFIPDSLNFIVGIFIFVIQKNKQSQLTAEVYWASSARH